MNQKYLTIDDCIATMNTFSLELMWLLRGENDYRNFFIVLFKKNNQKEYIINF